MSQPVSVIIENSIEVAWDFLERTGELGDPETASRFLLSSVEAKVRSGERRMLMLSNTAISDYKKFRAERRGLEIVVC